MKYLLILTLLCASNLNAQRFNAGAVLGVNFSQIDGDYQFGFSKKGIVAGARAITYLNPLLELNIDLLYSQRGARPSRQRPDVVHINLNFVETLFLLNFKVPKTEKEAVSSKRKKKRKLNAFIPFHLHLGASFGRLTHSEVIGLRRPTYVQFVEQEVSFEEIRQSFNRNDISVVGGMSYFFTKHVGSSFRFYIPTNKLYNSTSFPDRLSRSMRSYFLTAQLVYLL